MTKKFNLMVNISIKIKCPLTSNLQVQSMWRLLTLFSSSYLLIICILCMLSEIGLLYSILLPRLWWLDIHNTFPKTVWNVPLSFHEKHLFFGHILMELFCQGIVIVNFIVNIFKWKSIGQNKSTVAWVMEFDIMHKFYVGYLYINSQTAQSSSCLSQLMVWMSLHLPSFSV